MRIRDLTAGIVGVCAMLIAWPAESRLSAQTRVSAPRFALRVPTAPTVANGENGAFLVYELHLTNFVAQPWTLQKVEVLSGEPNARVLFTLADAQLGLAVMRPGTTIPVDQRRVLAGGAWGVVMMWVPIGRNALPASISHRVTFVYGGDPSINARFAIDYVKLGEDDQPYTADRTRNENHLAYGQEALAVADGLVVATTDALPDNTPFSGSPGPPDLDTILGNHVILEIGPRLYATYAHLKPGSLRVAKGQRVTRGHVIGLVGNSGNSGLPHLHFQLSEAPSVTSEGVPYTHDAFEVLGRCQMTGPTPAEQSCTRAPAETHRGEIPMQGLMIRFR